jgi:hypothetical protein
VSLGEPPTREGGRNAQLAAEQRSSDDLGKLAGLTFTLATENSETFPLRRQARAAPDGTDDDIG